MLTYIKKINYSNLETELGGISQKIETLKFPKGFLEFILYSISEIFANIIEHSMARNISVKIVISQKKCIIEISDDGIGLRSSYLKKKIYPKDDFSAIEFALSGLSSKDSKERGFGLYSVRGLVEALAGRQKVETGLARAIIEKNKINFQKIAKKRQGVFISIESSIRAIDFYKIIK